jgi:ABC-type branched-subunit amino acid transport system ATPase component
MIIKLKTQYKSLTKISQIDLPNFVILTGLNGAGKTQLLEAIEKKNAVVEVNGTPLSDVKLFRSGLGSIATRPFYGSKLERFCIALESKVSSFNYHVKTQNSPVYKFETYFTKDEQRILGLIESSKCRSSTENNLYVGRMDIMKCVPPDFVIPDDPKDPYSDIFQADLSQLFKRYQILKAKNDYECYLKDKKGRTDVDALSEADFLQKHGEAPWILANEIMVSADIGYIMTTPEHQDPEEPFIVKVVDELNGLEISLSDLSSGEQVLMSLSLALYNAELDRRYPQLLLLDEPDCHLHPAMAGKLLTVIEDVFVKRRGVHVIMTTHSPSTVALAPEAYLYAMSKAEGRISKLAKDRCIKLVTAGVPSLSIDFESRIQVFVESKYDAIYYGEIYEALKSRTTTDISLSFISSGTGGSGSSDQVREIVSLLRKNGNGKIYGIIDWDGSNNCSPFVKVSAEGERYSLENIILDPLLVGIYLIRESFLNPEAIGLKSRSYVAIGNTQPQVSYVGGLELVAPVWYLQMDGHVLERAIKAAFPPLNRVKNEHELKHNVVKKVIRDFPQFVPLSLLQLFEALQHQHVD